MSKKYIISLMILSVLAVSATGCGQSDESSSSSAVQDSSAVEVTTEETTAETSEETTTTAVEETTTEETTVISTEEETEPQTETVAEQTGEVITNKELLRMINDSFGMFSDKTFESDVQVAKDWDILDSDDVIEPDEPVTAEFLISVSMRATGFVNGQSSMQEIIDCAIEYNVIDSSDISAIDLSNAADIVEKAYNAWLNPHFDNSESGGVELADGVIDFNGVIAPEDVKFTDEGIEIPPEYAKDIEAGTVFIVPEVDGDGKAYKAQAVIISENVAVIDAVPADFLDVYKSIDISF